MDTGVGSMKRGLPMLPIFLVVFLDMVGIGIAIPVIAAIFFEPDGAHMGIAQGALGAVFGLLIASYPLAQFFGTPILGGLSDHYGRKKLLLLSIAGTAIGYLIFGSGVIYASLPLLFIGRIIDGFTGGNISIAMSAIADMSDEKSKVKNFGLIGMAFGLGFIIGPFLGGRLADSTLVPWFNQSTPFFAAALLAVVNIVFVLAFFSETLSVRTKSEISPWMGFRNIGKALSMPSLRTMFIVVFLLTFGFALHAQFFQVYLIKKFAFTVAQVGDVFAFLGICVAIVQGTVVRQIARKVLPEQVLVFSVPLLAVAIFSVILPQDSGHIYLIVPFVALFQGLTMPNYNAIVSNLAGKEAQGEILGVNQSVQALGQALPPLIAGVALLVDVRLPIVIASAVTLMAFLMFTMVFLKEKKGKFHEL